MPELTFVFLERSCPLDGVLTEVTRVWDIGILAGAKPMAVGVEMVNYDGRQYLFEDGLVIPAEYAEGPKNEQWDNGCLIAAYDNRPAGEELVRFLQQTPVHDQYHLTSGLITKECSHIPSLRSHFLVNVSRESAKIMDHAALQPGFYSHAAWKIGPPFKLDLDNAA